MSDLSGLLNAGGADALLLVPTAIALGALHGLEPGHSKTMMAAFIVAVRGTVAQAVLLGVAATVSHTLVVWLIAMTGLYFGSQWRAEHAEPYLQLFSGGLMLLVAAWMGLRYWREQSGAAAFAEAGHDHGHYHHHHHDHHHGHGHDHGHAHAGHDHDQDQDQEHEHEHEHELDGQAEHGRQDHHHRNFGHPRRRPPLARSKEARFKQELIAVDGEVFADAHERKHALEINRRFSGAHATTGQIVMFGLTGGLIPCPASITVLLLCLQVGKIGLGALLVLCFSIGLAATLVLVGVAAALSLRHAGARFKRFGALAGRAPYLSSTIVALIGAYTIYLGFSSLS